MYQDDNDNEIKVTTFKKSDKVALSKRLIIVLVCVFAAFTVLVAAVAGIIGSKISAKNTANNLSLYTSRAAESPLPSSNNSIVSVVDAVADTVVEINCTVVSYDMFNRPTKGTSAGSGVVISESGLIITNQHVVDSATKITVIMRDGTSSVATYIGGSSTDDIAIIRINKTDLPYAVFGDSDALKVGETVVAIGNPLGTLGGTVTSGIVSALDRMIDVEGVTMRLLQTNAAINPGNSGGGLFNLSGELIGIVSAKTSAEGIEGLGFAIPSNHALEIATSLSQSSVAQSA